MEKAFLLYTKSKLWLKEGGFNLRKFVTNSSVLQRRIDLHESCPVRCMEITSPNQNSSEEVSYAKHALGGDESHQKSLKVLGIQWNPVEDMFTESTMQAVYTVGANQTRHCWHCVQDL